MTLTDWILAFALVCIIEGFLPFVAPGRWLQAIREISESVSEPVVRRLGLLLLTVGVSIIWVATL